MQLPARHRRNVIEDLLDINVFSKMNVILREKTSILKDEIKELSYNLEIANNRVATQKKYIQDVKQLTDQNIESKNKEIDEARASIDDLVLKNSDMTKDLEELAPQNKLDLKETSDKKTDILHKQARLRSSIETLVKNAKFYEDNNSCPTCEQTITEEFRAKKIKLTKEEAKALSDNMTVLQNAAAEVEDKLTATNKIASKLTTIQNDITNNNKEIERLTRLVKKTLDEISSDSVKDLNEAKAELEKIIETVTEANDQKTKANEQYSYNLAMSEMLKDTGIKTKIIKQYLPVMNTLVNQYLQVLDFYVHFDLDEEFNETIRSRHRDVFTYDSFSEGEKQRIDLSLLFTWRQIAKMKNSVSTNLLILDETFDSSLDHDGVENLLKILNTLGDGTNIFVISHKGEILNGKFDDTIEFKKERNFSKIAA